MTGTWPPVPPQVVDRALLPEQPEPDRVKILHVITRLAGGSGENTVASAVGMDPQRYDVWIAGGAGDVLWQRAQDAGVRTVPLRHMREQISPLADAACLVDLVRLMRRERFTVVHTHCAKAGLLARTAASLVGVPVVVHTFHALAVHDFMSRPRRALYLGLERSVRPLADHYVAVAPRLARQAVTYRLARPGATSVVVSGVDLSSAPTSSRAAALRTRTELGIPASAPVVGTVGRLVAQKAPLDFVRMAAAVQRTHPDAWFVMVGDASHETRPLEERVRSEARRLGANIVFTGFRTDAPLLAAGFDVYVVPSLYEGLGRALTEAMASGRPVVATAVNGVPDLVEPGATGLLARPGDPESLASGVRWLLDHPAEGRAMGRQGRERVLAGLHVERMCQQLDELYAGLLGAPEQPRPPASVLPGRQNGHSRRTQVRSLPVAGS